MSRSKSQNAPRWYRDGLQFECTGCGDCCTGAPGYVWVTKDEIAELAALVGEMDVSQFERKYVRKVGIRKSLKEDSGSNWDCVFFDNVTRKCKVYAARPRQCRTWPFWESNLRTREDWSRTCAVCPGSGQGKLYQLESIDQQRNAVRV